MKRILLFLLSLGIIMAFSMSAFAVDVKFSGEYYVSGLYVDRVDLSGGHYSSGTSSGGTFDSPSTAFYFQRLRVQTDFFVSPGLKLVTRFDAMERIWGGVRSEADEMEGYIPLYGDSAGTRTENENIAFDWAYIEYASPMGVFTVGYQPDGGWGTVFADNEVNGVSVGKIGWVLTKGGFTGRVQIAKLLDLSNSAIFNYYNSTDRDIDKYSADIKYAWNGGEAGLRGFYWRSAAMKPIFETNVYGVIPYAKAKIGPVTVQAEVDYYWGDAMKWEIPAPINDIKLQNIGVFLDAVADFNMFYAGGTFAYISGDDPNTDKLEGGIYYGDYGIGLSGGKDWNPCLIMFNYDVVTKWVGVYSDHIDRPVGGPMTNAWFGQGRVGVRPVSNLDIMASVSYAKADKKPFVYDEYEYVGKSYGWEVDVTGTYKITNNLSYMLGVGYLFTGDYFKGACYNGIVENNYMIINKLTLSF